MTCAVTGPVSVVDEEKLRTGSKEGAELFSESKGLNIFKDKVQGGRGVGGGGGGGGLGG